MPGQCSKPVPFRALHPAGARGWMQDTLHTLAIYPGGGWSMGPRTGQRPVFSLCV